MFHITCLYPTINVVLNPLTSIHGGIASLDEENLGAKHGKRFPPLDHKSVLRFRFRRGARESAGIKYD